MDYPVLVNRGKPRLRGGLKKKTRMPKTKAPAAGGANRRKSGVAGRKAAPPRPSQPAPAPDDSKPPLRRLRAHLALAQARIDELRASAESDCPLDLANRRGFEREL